MLFRADLFFDKFAGISVEKKEIRKKVVKKSLKKA